MIKIDPELFTNDEWSEMYYAAGVLPGDRRPERPVRRSARNVQLIAECCRSKALAIRRGELGPEAYRGENRKWIAELRSAAQKLSKLLPKEEKCPNPKNS